jgi:2-polyprenyl-3-methyl-5-hydroxy-6-metoxy-1,4-benzoquinol methylase
MTDLLTHTHTTDQQTDSGLEAYYDRERPEVLSLVPGGARQVLDLGCGGGALGEALKRRQECHVTGIETRAEPAAHAARRLDRVIEADCESLDLDACFHPGEFDCLVTADVLEHLRDPEAFLRRFRKFLAPNAFIVASIPNVRHAGVLQEAVRGYWTYQDEGILDRTHLRFFTRHEIETMLARLAFAVEEWRTVDDVALAEWERLGRPASPTFGALTVEGFDERETREFFVIQWLVRARVVRTDLQRSVANESGPPTDSPWVPPITVAENQTRRLAAEARSLAAELARRDEQLRQLDREHAILADAHRQLWQRYASLRAQRDAAEARLTAILRSSSWRFTEPLRTAGRRAPILSASSARVRALVRNHPVARRRTRRLARWVWLGVTFRLPGRVAARLRSRVPSPNRSSDRSTSTSHRIESTPVLVLHPIEAEPAPTQLPHHGDRGRLICLTHVLPYPPGAGNEYRIHHMLAWLARQGWDIVLLVCPLPNEPVSPQRVVQAGAVYPNVIVCERDGTIFYKLSDATTLIDGLGSRHARSSGLALDVADRGEHIEPELVGHMRTFCPDVLIDLLVHLDARFEPDVLLAEYVFMTRPFPLLRPQLHKIVDTHDVFSTKATKVVRYGVADSLALTTEAEAELLNRADTVIAIQPTEAEELRALVPERTVISVGVDFDPIERISPPAVTPTVLVVGSANDMNVKGLRDFLRLAWPHVLARIPDAELHVVGSIGDTVDPLLSGVRILGRVDDLTEAYASARVVINPAVAGTGLKIKTLEALCHLRPIVLWPSGVDGLPSELQGLCHQATNWFEFAQLVVETARTIDAAQQLIDHGPYILDHFASARVYAPLAEVMDARIPRRL